MLARVLLLSLALARALPAQDAPAERHAGPSPLKFLAGAGVAFVTHESGHLGLDLLFQARPYLRPVQFGPIPFFAVVHHRDLTIAQDYATTAAGFWVQAATNEWTLSRHPHLRAEHRPMLKGALMFNIVMPAAYTLAGALGIGPEERDPLSMAQAVRTSEAVVGAFVFVPAVLDGYRYLHPDRTWAAWASRAMKLGSVALALRATSR